MANRSYRQHCALARALDVVGERWTLLLLRDLSCAPRRYGELLEGLPGIGTNLLAARLKTLAAEGLVGKSADGGYALTPAGRELEPALVALARFGAARLGEPKEGELWRALWTPLAMKATFRAERSAGVDDEYEFHIDGEVFWVRIRGGAATTGDGPAKLPDFVLTTSGATLLELAHGRLTPGELVARDDVDFVGALAALERCDGLFGLPSGVASQRPGGA